MDIKQFVEDWLAASNAYDINTYLAKWHNDAVLEDPSVGHVFKGHAGIQKYFEDYFIGYKTKTRLINLQIISDIAVHVDVEFTGLFPEAKIGGVFDLLFNGDKIVWAKANLS
jgi:ketosteroid isomerase-like protein